MFRFLCVLSNAIGLHVHIFCAKLISSEFDVHIDLVKGVMILLFWHTPYTRGHAAEKNAMKAIIFQEKIEKNAICDSSETETQEKE